MCKHHTAHNICRHNSHEAMRVTSFKAGHLIACCFLRREMEVQAQSTDNGAGSGQLQEMPGTYPHFGLAILLLYGMNTGLSKFTQTAGIQFPSALIGTVPQCCPTTAEDVESCALCSEDASPSASLPQVLPFQYNIFATTTPLSKNTTMYWGGRSFWPTMTYSWRVG